MNPTLYPSNWSSAKAPGQHGPGRRLCAMAAPRQWEHGDGRVDRCAPTLSALRLVQATGDLAGYRAILDDRWTSLAEYLRPGALLIDDQGGDWEGVGPAPARLVRDGDTLLCACARPDSKARVHPCHLELLAPHLVRAGWDVVLWGQRMWLQPELTTEEIGVDRQDEFDEAAEEGCEAVAIATLAAGVWTAQVNGFGLYNPSSFGWPQ